MTEPEILMILFSLCCITFSLLALVRFELFLRIANTRYYFSPVSGRSRRIPFSLRRQRQVYLRAEPLLLDRVIRHQHGIILTATVASTRCCRKRPPNQTFPRLDNPLFRAASAKLPYCFGVGRFSFLFTCGEAGLTTTVPVPRETTCKEKDFRSEMADTFVVSPNSSSRNCRYRSSLTQEAHAKNRQTDESTDRASLILQE